MLKHIKAKRLKKSLRSSFWGLKIAVKQEQSFFLQALAGLAIILLMFFLPMLNIERALLVLTIGFVLALELINSQVERVVDLIKPENDILAKTIKDLSSAAVLIASVAALAIGAFIILPYLF